MKRKWRRRREKLTRKSLHVVNEKNVEIFFSLVSSPENKKKCFSLAKSSCLLHRIYAVKNIVAHVFVVSREFSIENFHRLFRIFSKFAFSFHFFSNQTCKSFRNSRKSSQINQNLLQNIAIRIFRNFKSTLENQHNQPIWLRVVYFCDRPWCRKHCTRHFRRRVENLNPLYVRRQSATLTMLDSRSLTTVVVPDRREHKHKKYMHVVCGLCKRHWMSWGEGLCLCWSGENESKIIARRRVEETTPSSSPCKKKTASSFTLL